MAHGDFSSKAVFTSRDELGGLTRSFAEMTTQLSDARELVQKSVVQVEGARANLQTILDNLTAGVIVFDRSGAIDTVNPGATRILRLPLSAYRGRRLEEVHRPRRLRPGRVAALRDARRQPRGGRARPLAGLVRAADRAACPARERPSITLLVRGAAMPQGARLMVFDDITELVSAQRVEAWSEVARRLAHEIKNPLTPIQLSAERLQLKLAAKLEGADQAMLASLGRHHRQPGPGDEDPGQRVPRLRAPARPRSSCRSTSTPWSARCSACTARRRSRGGWSPSSAETCRQIVGDGTQLRQVIHNLVQNALDAVAEQTRRAGAGLSPRRSANEQGEVRAVRLIVLDNGPRLSRRRC